MKKMKLITNLILPAIAIGAVAAPIMLTTACTKNFEIGPFLNTNGGPVSAVCEWSGSSSGSTTFEVGSTHTFVFTTVNIAKGYPVIRIPLFMDCYIPDNTDAQSNPDLYFTKEYGANTLTIKILQSIHANVSIKTDINNDEDYGRINPGTFPWLYIYSEYISFNVA